MPISLQEVLDKRQEPTELVRIAIDYIDNELSDGRVCRNNAWAPDTNLHYSFDVEGTATLGDCRAIIEAYKQVGWGTVIVLNSENCNEPPGKVKVTLFQHDQTKADSD